MNILTKESNAYLAVINTIIVLLATVTNVYLV
jgi:hypothetical protein